MSKISQNIFENTGVYVLTSIVVAVIPPTAAILQNSNPQSEQSSVFLAPAFIGACLVSIVLLVLMNYCRTLYFAHKRLNEKIDGLGKHNDNSEDEILDLLKLYQAVNNRKLNHLHRSITNIHEGMNWHYNEPESALTDGEEALMKKLMVRLTKK